MSETPARICHLFSSQEVGGMEKHVLEQCRWQCANTSAQIAVIGHPRYRAMFAQEVTFLPLNTDRSRRNLLLSFELQRTIRHHGFDLVHAHGGKPAYLLRHLKPFLRCKLVVTRHNISNPKDGVSRYFPNRIAVSKRAVSNSNLTWDIVPNGTEMPLLPTRSPQALEPGRPAVLSVARLVQAKGIDTLLRAWKLAKTGNAILYLLGDGPELNSLQALASQLKISESVRFIGFSEQIPDWYAAADLTAISSCYEGGPYTVAEALLSECPIVSTDVGYVAENIPLQYITGINSPQTFADLLSKALAQPAKLREDYQAYFTQAKTRLTLEAMARSTWQVYARARG